MSKKLIIAVVVILVAGALWYKGMKKAEDPKLGGPASGGTVSYKCEENKTFLLRYVDANTVRLEGTGITNTALDVNVAGYWVSADSKITAKTVGTYAVVVQNNVTTHDRCMLQM